MKKDDLKVGMEINWDHAIGHISTRIVKYLGDYGFVAANFEDGNSVSEDFLPYHILNEWSIVPSKPEWDGQKYLTGMKNNRAGCFHDALMYLLEKEKERQENDK